MCQSQIELTHQVIGKDCSFGEHLHLQAFKPHILLAFEKSLFWLNNWNIWQQKSTALSKSPLSLDSLGCESPHPAEYSPIVEGGLWQPGGVHNMLLTSSKLDSSNPIRKGYSPRVQL